MCTGLTSHVRSASARCTDISEQPSVRIIGVGGSTLPAFYNSLSSTEENMTGSVSSVLIGLTVGKQVQKVAFFRLQNTPKSRGAPLENLSGELSLRAQSRRRRPKPPWNVLSRKPLQN